MRLLTWSLTALFLLPAVALSADDTKKDREKLKGTWDVVTWVQSGKAVSAQAIKGCTVTFSEDKMTIKTPGIAITFFYEMDANTKPKTINRWYEVKQGDEKKPSPGIYELDGDTLKVCWDYYGQPKPTEFGSKDGSSLEYMLLKRPKK